MRDENNKGIATVVLIIAIAVILFIEVGFVIYILFYSKETSDVNNFEETSNDGKIIKNSNGYKVIPSTEIQY